MRKVFYRGTVHPWLCDSMGHLSSRYIYIMFDESALHLLNSATGWSHGKSGWESAGWVDVRNVIDYAHELTVGSLTKVCAEIVNVGNTSLTVLYELVEIDSEMPAATMEATYVFFDLEKRRSMPIHDDMRESIKAFQASH